jgi:hypothetical protein
MAGLALQVHELIANHQLTGLGATLATNTRPVSKVRTSLSETMSLYLRNQINLAIGDAANGKLPAARDRIEQLFNTGTWHDKPESKWFGISKTKWLGISPNAATDVSTLLKRLDNVAKAKENRKNFPPDVAAAKLDTAIEYAGKIKFKTNFATTGVGGFMRHSSLVLNAFSGTGSLLTFLATWDWTGLAKAGVGGYGAYAQWGYIRKMYEYKRAYKLAVAGKNLPRPTWDMITKAGDRNNFGYVLNSLADTAIGVNYLVHGEVANGMFSLTQAAGEFGLYLGSGGRGEKLRRDTLKLDGVLPLKRMVPLAIILQGAGAVGLLVIALTSPAPAKNNNTPGLNPAPTPTPATNRTSPTTTPSPTTSSSTTGPGQPPGQNSSPPNSGQPGPVVTTVRVGDHGLITLWDISHANEGLLLTDEQKNQQNTLSSNEVTVLALNDLYGLNPQFDPAREGKGPGGNPPRRDPDLIFLGEPIVVSVTEPAVHHSRAAV